MTRVLDTKRLFDIGLSAFALGLFIPVQVASSIAIRNEDGGPALFPQERIGKARRPFRVLKLRTMHEGQVTRMGRWLRGTGLDETMQFWNVLRGEMSIVGPRPLTQRDLERLNFWRDDARFSVRPGITGLAQIFGGKSARHSRALDALYARRPSLTLDLRLIAISFAMNLFGKERIKRGLRQSRRATQRLRMCSRRTRRATFGLRMRRAT